MMKAFVFSLAGLVLSAHHVYGQAAPQPQALAKDDLVRVCPPSLTAKQIKTLQGDESTPSYGNHINFFSPITVPQLQDAGLLPKDVHGVAGGSLLEFARDPKTTGNIVGGRGFTWSSVQSGKTRIERADAVIEDGKLACVYRYKRSYLGGDASFKIYLVGKDRHAE